MIMLRNWLNDSFIILNLDSYTLILNTKFRKLYAQIKNT